MKTFDVFCRAVIQQVNGATKWEKAAICRELREHLEEIPKDKPVYVICQSGLRSYIACRILAGNGYDCYNFSGGFRFYDAVINDRSLVEKAYSCGMDQ